MDSHLKTLEFDLILQQIAAYSHTETTKKAINNLRPLFELTAIQECQNKIKEAILIASRSGKLPFLPDFDIIEILNLVKNQRQLAIRDLQYLRLFLVMSKEIKTRSNNFTKENLHLVYLAPYFHALDSFTEILDLIDSTIDPDGFVVDSASEKLFKIRKELAKAAQKRDQILNTMLIKRQGILNENILIMRNERYCLPVKTELKNQIKGIIHDVSASGTTTYIEPLEASEYSSLIVRLKRDEEAEIKQILQLVSENIFPEFEQLNYNLTLLIKLDLYFSAAYYSLKYNCQMPQTNLNGNVNLIAARHPLIDPEQVVPVNIRLSEMKPVLMITGPNTGGKTVALKTIGLLSLMAQSGLLIPASQDSEVSIFQGIYADIGDLQSISQSLSTFSSHIKNITTILNNLTGMSLVLLDELGSGTDPNEGVSLAKAIIDYLLAKKVRLVLTTHYSELKIYAYQSPLIENASVRFDELTLKPLYLIDYGRSGSSNAIKIAQRLGLDEKVVTKANQYLTEKATDLSSSVKVFEEKQELLAKRLANVASLEKELTFNEEKLQAEILKLEKEKNKIVEVAKKTATEKLERVYREAEVILANLEKATKEHEIATLKYELRNLKFAEEKVSLEQDLQVGDYVYIKKYNQTGQIEKIEKDKYFVKFGMFSLPFKNEDLVPSTKPKVRAKITRERAKQVKRPTITAAIELDLRGFRYEDVEAEYKKFIDNAILANLKELRIIHGFGTGAVRKALYEQLKNDQNVESYRYGGEHEGLNGVTIVKLI